MSVLHIFGILKMNYQEPKKSKIDTNTKFKTNEYLLNFKCLNDHIQDQFEIRNQIRHVAIAIISTIYDKNVS